jgi:hypothetical protein
LTAALLPFLFAPAVAAAAPGITGIRWDPAGPVAAYSKFEIRFQVTGTVATRPQWPFDAAPPRGVPPAAGISVNALFTDPDGRQYTQPAFYAEEFDSQVRDGRDWHLPTGVFGWRVRFSPGRVGRWTYRLSATDRSGASTSDTFGFEVVPSAARGFVRVSTADRRYFEFDDGSLFWGMGVQMPPLLDSPETKGKAEYERLGQAGVNLVRMWASAIFGSAWNTWIGGRNQYRGYLPVTGLVPYRDPATGDTALTMLVAYGPGGDTGWFDACRMQLWWEDQAESVKPHTTYRLTVEYYGVGIEGPRTRSSSAFGLVAKIDPGWHPDCHEPGTGTVVTTYGGDTAGVGSIEGRWDSGEHSFLPRMYLGLENVRGGRAFIRSVSLREELGGDRLGPEMMIQPSMEHELYVPEEKAFSLDRIVEHAERNGVYLKLVVMDKGDKIYSKMADDGGWVTSGPDNADGFYGVGRRVNKTRWLQQMWWRYLQARWGYSPAIHSWELTNEGDPASVRHYELADEFGKFMHCRVFGVEPGAGDGAACSLRHPNAHLVTTSFWRGFPAAEFWSNPKYPNVDYADLHAYVSTSFAPASERASMAWDAAYFHLWHSDAVASAGVGKPVVRGEAGLDAPGQQDESILGLGRDTLGVWLHNFLWAGLDRGALTELYWWTSHIWSDLYDHRGEYAAVRAFMGDVPLNRGGYVDWGGSVVPPVLRVVGQKNVASGVMHLWVQNPAHTWKRVADGGEIEPRSARLVVPGFGPGRRYVLERWDTHAVGGRIAATEELAADELGRLTIPVDSLVRDVALKVRTR